MTVITKHMSFRAKPKDLHSLDQPPMSLQNERSTPVILSKAKNPNKLAPFRKLCALPLHEPHTSAKNGCPHLDSEIWAHSRESANRLAG